MINKVNILGLWSAFVQFYAFFIILILLPVILPVYLSPTESYMGFPVVITLAGGCFMAFLGTFVVPYIRFSLSFLVYVAVGISVFTLGLIVLPGFAMLGDFSFWLFLCFFGVQMFGFSLLKGGLFKCFIPMLVKERMTKKIMSFHVLPIIALLCTLMFRYITENSFLGVSKNSVTGFVTDNWHEGWGSWRGLLGLTLLFCIPLFVLLKKVSGNFFRDNNITGAENSTRTIEYTSKKPVIFFSCLLIGGGFMCLLAYIYIPSFLEHIIQLGNRQAIEITLWAGGFSLIPFLFFVWWGRKLGMRAGWIALVGILLFALMYKPFLDTMITTATPNRKQELLDKKTENIKHRKFFNKANKGEYLYTVRTTIRKQYYETGMVITSRIQDTIEDGLLVIHPGSIPLKITDKRLGNGQIFTIVLLLWILMVCAGMTFAPLCSFVFLLFRASVFIEKTPFAIRIYAVWLCFFAALVMISAVHLAYPQWGRIQGINGLLVGMYVVHILLALLFFVGLFYMVKYRKAFCSLSN